MSNVRFSRVESMPPVVKNLLIINALVYIAQITFGKNGSIDIEGLFALHDVRSLLFKPWQLVTYMFLHSPTDITHIIFNMFALWMFGRVLENVWGAKRFLFFYMMCGIGAGLLHLGTLYYEMTPLWESFKRDYTPEQQQQILDSGRFIIDSATLGASGAIFGCLAAFGYLFPNSLIYVYMAFPIKAKWFVLIYAGIELWMGVRNSAGDSVAHFAHLGGALVGFLIVFIWNKTRRRSLY